MEYREFLLPKKGGKGFRRITAPDAELKTYQRGMLRRLEQLWEESAELFGIAQIQHGFLPDRNPITGATKHIGYRTTISMDLSDFFDSVTKAHIAIFDEEIAQDDNLFHVDGHTSQGFVTSPILANIAIVPALNELNQWLDNEFTDFALTMYADDITISINSEELPEIINVINQTQVIFETYGFRIKPTKTRIRYAKYGWRRVLGVMVGEDSLKATRKIRNKMRAARHQESWNSLGGLTAWSRCLLPKSLR